MLRVIRTVLYGGQVAGSVASYVDADLGHPEVTYWIGPQYWGRGVATAALSEFLNIQAERPIYGRAASDNLGSLRVLEKCGFEFVEQTSSYSRVRGCDVAESVLRLL